MAILIGECLLRQRLREVRMSQEALAKRLNISQQMVSRFVNNKDIMSLEMAFNVADVLGCSVNDLYRLVYVRNRNE